MASKIILTFLFLGSVLSTSYGQNLYCKDPEGRDVDWFIAYKIPKNTEVKNPKYNPENPGRTKPTISADYPMNTGHAFAYLLGPPISRRGKEQTTEWKLSKELMTSVNSMFGKTLAPLHANPNGVSYVMYNDEPPHESGVDKSGTRAHAKGVVGMNGKSGFWLIHSIPAFAQVPTKKYEYPDSGEIYGQTALCISFNPKKEAQDITTQLRHFGPNVYAHHLTKEIAGIAPDFEKLDPQKTDKPPTGKNIAEVTSVKGTNFKSFARNRYAAPEGDLYSVFVAPELKNNMVVETWRRGSGNPLDSFCDHIPEGSFKVANINKVKIPFSKDSSSGEWGYLQDHSKWGMTDPEGLPFVCIGDINRMRSQYINTDKVPKGRGGGTVCFENKAVWTRFSEVIVESDCGLIKH